ncbi:DUF5615 family PIN-like protein [Candidatus Poribacteria bacterium]|nr:DUF5615 family PIN-like protein [Candidatus Poribacteria bacterium]
MKFKLDENLGTQTQALIKAAGHDVQTVRSQKLQGCSDQHLYEACRNEQRCLITLDLDFSDVLHFPPAGGGGIVVVRVPQNPSLPLLEQLVRRFLNTLPHLSVEGKLWIVEIGRIRIHESETDTGS